MDLMLAFKKLDEQVALIKKQLKARILDSNVNSFYTFGIGGLTDIDTNEGVIGKHGVVYENNKCTVTMSYFSKTYMSSKYERFDHITHSTVLKGTMRHHYKDGSIKTFNTHDTYVVQPNIEYMWEVVEPDTELLTVFEPPL